MCGIIGFTGRLEAQKILTEGLAALEYRGYDSAGIAYFKAGAIQNSLRYDKQIKAAVKLLNSPEEYGKILHPVKK